MTSSRVFVEASPARKRRVYMAYENLKRLRPRHMSRTCNQNVIHSEVG